VRDRGGQVAGLARQQAQAKMGFGMGGGEVEHRAVQRLGLRRLAGRGFVRGGLQCFIDELPDRVAGGSVLWFHGCGR
jgi:hypothetical protein